MKHVTNTSINKVKEYLSLSKTALLTLSTPLTTTITIKELINKKKKEGLLNEILCK